MISVSDWFKTWMEKQTLNLLRKFTYDDIDETERVEGFGSINRASDKIISGGTSLSLINVDKHWNKFITDKSNLRKTAKLQLAIGVETTPARAGIARSGITVSGLIESGICIAGNSEWLDLLTGWGDDPEFLEALVTLPIRDKFANLLEVTLGSKEESLDYYSIAYNPADLAWDILTTHGGLDSTKSSANVDIDYDSWSDWKAACSTANSSLKARFKGESIREALELIRGLTNSDIYVSGEGKIKFFRFTQAAPPADSYLFDQDRFTDLSVKLNSEKIINYLKVYYGLNQILELITNGDMEAENSWTDRDSPTTNERSGEQAHSGSYSRKISTDTLFQGAYQDVPTVIGREYLLSGYAYVSAGDAVIGAGSAKRYFGNKHKGDVEGLKFVKDRTYCFEFTSSVAGKLKSMQVYIKEETAGGPYGKAKCALYSERYDGSMDLLGQTEEKDLPQGTDGWVTFNFSPRPSVEASTIYHLAIWFSASNYLVPYDTVLAWRGWDDKVYNTWPDPWSLGNTAHGNYLYSIFAVYADNDNFNTSAIATLASWTYLNVSFIAISSTTRIFFESNSVFASTFYVDDLSVKWKGPEYFDHYYLKEDAASQSSFKKSSKVVDGTIIWHTSLASATSYADRFVDIFKNPLTIAIFTAFMMGMISELGDIIRISDSFFNYVSRYFRIFRISDMNLAAATVTFEAADFQDVLYYFYIDNPFFGLLDQDYNPLY